MENYKRQRRKIKNNKKENGRFGQKTKENQIIHKEEKVKEKADNYTG